MSSFGWNCFHFGIFAICLKVTLKQMDCFMVSDTETTYKCHICRLENKTITIYTYNLKAINEWFNATLFLVVICWVKTGIYCLQSFCLHFESETKFIRFWKVPTRNVHFLDRVIETCFTVMVPCSLMVKHTWLKSISLLKQRIPSCFDSCQ